MVRHLSWTRTVKFNRFKGLAFEMKLKTDDKEGEHEIGDDEHIQLYDLV